MPLEIHNTLTGKRELFVPLSADEVTFYTCGPTVYDFAHIGNFRSFLAADVLRRWLESPLCQRVSPDGEIETDGFGYRVTHVMNLTDVGHMTDDTAADGGGEDKMEVAKGRLLEAKKTGALPAGVEIDPNDPRAIAAYYANAFLQDAKLLGMKVVDEGDADPTLLPRPTNAIKEMLEMILELIENKHAYIADDGVVYFDVSSFPDYGQLSGNTMDKLRTGAGGRIAAANQAMKKNPADFLLWKPDPAHLMRWNPSTILGKPVPIQEGYPGWHLECSVMARQRLGDVIDLHSGGEDNIFPHHECEIAQSRGATGEKLFARYWFHPRHLFVEGEKMSKSKGNFFTIRDLVKKGFEPAAIRLELIKTHYRSNANFTEQGLRDSARRVRRWRRYAAGLMRICNLPDVRKPPGRERNGFRSAYEADPTICAFRDALDFDLNISSAIATLDSISSMYDPDKQDKDDKGAAEIFERNNPQYRYPETEVFPLDRDAEADEMLPEQPMSTEEAKERIECDPRISSPFTELACLHLFDQVLGVIFTPKRSTGVAVSEGADTAKIESLVAQRTDARKSKDFARSDAIRDQLAAMGVEIKDSPAGTTWRRRAAL